MYSGKGHNKDQGLIIIRHGSSISLKGLKEGFHEGKTVKKLLSLTKLCVKRAGVNHMGGADLAKEGKSVGQSN